MKKLREIEVDSCDFCGKDSMYTCLNCGKDICHSCKDTKTKEYKFSLHFTGGWDGLYCLDCDKKLAEERSSQLHILYQEMESLRKEERKVYRSLKAKADEVERKIKLLNEAEKGY